MQQHPNTESVQQKVRDQLFYQLGIAAAGFGSFEQMLIGRTFLYDRLYHHHKVRAAEAMAQRLMLVAERDRKRRFDLGEIFLRVSDDTMLRIFAGDITHKRLDNGSRAAAALARGILDRELLHRAFAFRGRFIAVPPGLSRERIESASAGHVATHHPRSSNLVSALRRGTRIMISPFNAHVYCKKTPSMQTPWPHTPSA